MADNIKLPVPVLNGSHWRVNFQPETYNEELISSLRECLEIVEQTKISIRGWDYPHLSNRQAERSNGTNWVASWSDFHGHNEYWRFYQSGQFIHLFSVQEADSTDWREQLRAVAKSHIGRGGGKDRDWDAIPGFISVLNFLFTITEIFEFAARLSEKCVYQDQLKISIELRHIKGFLLVHESGRAWMNYYAATEENLGHQWQLNCQDLLTQSKEHSLVAAKWFFERFGWYNPSDQILRNDQQNFLNKRF